MTSPWLTSKPLYILAPMEDVTDIVFRRLVQECGRPSIVFTEFTNVEGLASAGNHIVVQRLKYNPDERPIIAQIWGKSPEHFYTAAQQIKKLGFDGIDLNMGCPEKKVIKNGCCAALINNHQLAHQIIEQTLAGAEGLPVSVKTRIGINRIETDTWIPFLLQHNLAAITVHGRTVKELSAVPVHWDQIAKAVELRNRSNCSTLIIANGDIMSLDQADHLIEQYHLDGVMIGRGIFHNPYLFSRNEKWKSTTLSDRLRLLQRHVQQFQETWGHTKPYAVLKKYFKIYISDIEGAAELRVKFMETQTPKEALDLAENYLTTNDAQPTTKLIL